VSDWHLLGAGSVGCWFAARLHAAGIPVTLLLRNAAARAGYLARDGITLELPEGMLHARPPAVIAGGNVPACLLVCTKTPDTLDALATVFPQRDAQAAVVLLQNGMGMAQAVQARWPRLRLYNAVTTAGIFRASPWRFHCVATGETCVAEPGRDAPAGDVAAIHAVADAGLWQTDSRIEQRLWQKLAVNAVINALTGIHQCRNGELENIDDAATLIPQLAAEVDAVAAAEGIRLAPDALTAARAVMRSTAGNLSSMNRDLAAGRRTEIDAINGFVVARASAHGIPVPANEQVLSAVHALEARSSG
jgi:2-dehydropantoate 2-reductase